MAAKRRRERELKTSGDFTSNISLHTNTTYQQQEAPKLPTNSKLTTNLLTKTIQFNQGIPISDKSIRLSELDSSLPSRNLSLVDSSSSNYNNVITIPVIPTNTASVNNLFIAVNNNNSNNNNSQQPFSEEPICFAEERTHSYDVDFNSAVRFIEGDLQSELGQYPISDDKTIHQPVLDDYTVHDYSDGNISMLGNTSEILDVMFNRGQDTNNLNVTHTKQHRPHQTLTSTSSDNTIRRSHKEVDAAKLEERRRKNRIRMALKRKQEREKKFQEQHQQQPMESNSSGGTFHSAIT